MKTGKIEFRVHVSFKIRPIRSVNLGIKRFFGDEYVHSTLMCEIPVD